MFASLHPGGRFLIETMGKEIMARQFHEKEWFEDGDTIVLLERKTSLDWTRINTRWIVIKDNHRIEHNVSVRSYSAVELSSVFSECGFTNLQVYGDLEGNEYDHQAKRLVVTGYN